MPAGRSYSQARLPTWAQARQRPGRLAPQVEGRSICHTFVGIATTLTPAEPHAGGCPSCGAAMRFTMLGQAPTATATLERPAHPEWQDPYAHGYEEIEATWACRYAQIGLGISTYLFIYRWGPRILNFVVGAQEKLPREKQAALLIAILIANCMAAFSGGFAAGFWARNWIVQGLGVLTGVLAIPLGTMLFMPPKDWTMFWVTLAATSILTLAGAFAGHVIVRPTRIPV